MVARLLLTAALALAAASPVSAQTDLTVFAAASLKNALDDVNAAFTARTGIKVTVSYGASSLLMRQVEQGAPADIFVSADNEWMQEGIKKKLIKADTRFELLGNRLVVIEHKDATLEPLAIGDGLDLSKLAGDGRIATADVRAVPLGKYAKAALEKLGAWKSVEPKLAMAENARAALALVARKETPLGIVYETDAKVEPEVKVIGTFPENAHPPIVYPAALTVKAKPEAKRYLDFLRSGTGQVLFERHGFLYRVKAGP